MRSKFDMYARGLVFALAAPPAVGVACTPSSDSAPQEVTTSRSVVSELQVVAERELEHAVSGWKASGGTILVMSPNGEVLAEAGGHSDRAYISGSTIKPILLAAAMDEGVVTESDVFDCSRSERDGKVLRDASPRARLALPELLARSSNVGFAQIFDRLGGARFSRALERFHFVAPPGLATASSGDWDGAMTAIGSTMSATPRQVARAYAALANGGDGIVKPETASRVRALLEGVVTSESGTGKRAKVIGVRVAGKTGSSTWTTADGATSTYASFVGYVPADHPRYVIFVGVESPSGDDASGGEVAAPVFSRVAALALAP